MPKTVAPIEHLRERLPRKARTKVRAVPVSPGRRGPWRWPASASPAAAPILDRIVARFAEVQGERDGADFRAALLDTYGRPDPRSERFWELVAIIRGCPWPAPQMVAHRWLVAALRHSVATADTSA